MSATKGVQASTKRYNPDHRESCGEKPKGSKLGAIPNNRAVSVRLDAAYQLRPNPACPPTIFTVVVSTQGDTRSSYGPVNIGLMVITANLYCVAQGSPQFIRLRGWTHITLDLGPKLVRRQRRFQLPTMTPKNECPHTNKYRPSMRSLKAYDQPAPDRRMADAAPTVFGPSA
jgi:hypothetical protein